MEPIKKLFEFRHKGHEFPLFLNRTEFLVFNAYLEDNAWECVNADPPSNLKCLY